MFLNNYACNDTIHLKTKKKSDFFGTITRKPLNQTEIFYFLKDLMNVEMNLIKIDDDKLILWKNTLISCFHGILTN
jgi:hypothetical protein